MKCEDFRKLVAGYPFFRSNLFPHLTDKPAVLRRQLVDWVKQGRVIVLKRGMYTLPDKDRAVAFLLAIWQTSSTILLTLVLNLR